MGHVLVIAMASFTYTNPWDQATWDQDALTTRAEEEDVLKGRTGILQSLRNPVKLTENKCKVLYLEWSEAM